MSSITCIAASSASRLITLFVRPTTQSPASLDFLYPAFTRRNIPSARQCIQPFIRQSISSPPVVSGLHTRRNFGSSSILQKTICAINPQKDEEGNDMHMYITDRAAKRLTKVMVRDKRPGLALKIQVESGGCHGFQYIMSLVDIPEQNSPEWSNVVTKEDSIFQYVSNDASEPGELFGSPKIILDESSLALLKDSKVEFTSELIGSQFKVDNPRATSSCGCGTSFDIQI